MTTTFCKQSQASTQLACRLALWHTAGIGPVKFVHIINRFKQNLDDIFTLPLQQLRQLGLSEAAATQLRKPQWALVEQDLLWQQHDAHHIICWDDPDYPQLLHEIPAAPPILFIRGHKQLLNNPQIAMVGSRNPTHTGRDNAYHFSAHLAQAGYTITSGFAIGIDTTSHQAALAKQGTTLAVLGTGIDHVYPRSNIPLVEKVMANGALISEFARNTQPLPRNFPRRNRIISGLSMGVLVVEAALKSGSLITANYANDQNRDVFAIPGSIHNPLARGCHALIRSGAKLVETANDIVEELGALSTFVKKQQIQPNLLESLDKDHQILVKCIGDEATPMDILLIRSGFMQQKVASILLELELNDIIVSTSSGYMRK